jgi:hypothetical protein
MDRPTHSKARLTLAIVATLAALSALSTLIAPAALAGPPAGEEYQLEIPGVRQNPSNTPVEAAATSESSGDGIQRGVVGEAAPPDTGLESVVAVLGSTPAALLFGLAALLAIALLRTPLASRSAASGPR